MPLKMYQAHAVLEKLKNDRLSTYDEMLNHFVNVINISEKAAKEYLACRSYYLNHPDIKPTR